MVIKKTSIGGALLLFGLVVPFQGLAQPVSPDPYPLRPPDTSSPRDTLRSFLTLADKRIKLWFSGVSRDTLFQSGARAAEMLDFGQIPDRHLAETQARNSLLLKEILDRIALPPDDQIPGDKEVADQGITRWTIPDTRITIAQVTDGPRQGEFLFTADTVRRLGDMYRRAKHLPYQPGATEGAYDRYLEAQGLTEADVARVRDRLKPVDTSSPRATFAAFWQNLDRAYWLIMDANFALDSDPPTMSVEQGREIEKEADFLFRRAMSTVDLSQLPEAIRDDVGIEAVLQLKEVLDRVARPYSDSIPDEETIRDWRLDNKDVLSTTPRPFSWQVPNTEIAIVEVTEGPRVGEFLFSADTVSQAETFYRRAQDLPYRQGASEGFFKFFISTPGYLVPDAYPLARWFDELPPGFNSLYADQTLWQWLGLALSMLALIVAGVLIFVATRRLARHARPVLQEWLHFLRPILNILVVFLVHEFINRGLNITGYVLVVVTNILEGIVYALAAWAVYALFKAFSETLVATRRFSQEGIDASLIRLGARLVGFLMGAWLLIEGLQELGVHVVPLLAGLGVGGLALALAARPTIANIIGSFMIFADKPYKVGQRVMVMGHQGNVESIGLRSTKIRLLNGHLTSIPNEQMASVDVENIGQRPHIRRVCNINLTYDTPPDKVVRAEEIIQEILAVPGAPDPQNPGPSEALAGAASKESDGEQQPHPNEAINQPDFPPRVFFNDFNPASLNILVVYWFHPPEYWDYLAHARWINLQIMERFRAEGIDFAFPTQTLHLAGDDKRPLTVGQRWVSEEEDLSHGAVLAQAAALGAQTVLTNQVPASESARPEPVEFVGPLPEADGKRTAAGLEGD